MGDLLDPKPGLVPVTSSMVLASLRQRWRAQEYAHAEEVLDAPGFDTRSRMDFLAFGLWPSTGNL